MTVPSTTRRAGPFTGTGALVAYPFAFKVFAKQDLAVTIADANGLETDLVLDSTFTVTLNVDQEATPGGTVNYAVGGVATALPSGYTLVVTGDGLEFEQTADLPQGGNFSPVVIENALDRIVMLLQRLWDGVRRSMRLPDTASDNVSTVLPVPTANNFIGWDSNGTALRNVDPNTLATVVAFAAWQSQAFSGDGATTQFTLSSDPGNVNNLDVVVGAVPQRNNVDFTLSGVVLTFDVAPANGLSIFCRWGQALPEGTSTLQTRLASDAVGNGDALVAAKRVITDAVATTLHAVNELRAYSPEDVGAPADGVTDDAPYVQKLYDYIRTVAGRGKIVLTPGKTYYFNSQITYADNSALVGTGAKIKVGTGFAGVNKPLLKNFSGTQFSDNSTRIASTNVSFIDLEFDGQDTGVNGTTVADANMHGVLICAGTWYPNSGVDGFTVHNCNMYSFAGAGAMAWKSTNVRITSNRFKNFFANTSLSIGSCIDLHECERFGIVGNQINHTAAGLSWHGMVVLDWDDGSKDGVITGNIITNMNGGDGISCEGNGGAGSNLERCLVGDNDIYNCNGQGIGVDGCVSVTVHDNRIKSVIGPGILYTGCTRVKITDNDIDGSALGGIVGQSGCSSAIITGNEVRAITYTSASYRGIGIEFVNSALSASTSCVIGNNIVSDCDGPGIYAEVYGATISGNRVNACGVTASLSNTLRAGIVAMEHSVVSGNFIRSNGSAHYAISSVSANFPTLGTNGITGTYLTAYYYIGYRFGVSMNTSATIYKATYDAESDVFVGWFNGTPSGAWKVCDIMYDTTPSAGGFVGSICTNTTGPVWKTFGAISA